MNKLYQYHSRIMLTQEIIFYFRNNFCLEHHVPRSMIIHIQNVTQSDSLNVQARYAGAADLLVVHSGEIFFVDLKNPDCKKSNSQRKFQAHCEVVGMRVFIVANLSEFKELILRICPK